MNVELNVELRLLYSIAPQSWSLCSCSIIVCIRDIYIIIFSKNDERLCDVRWYDEFWMRLLSCLLVCVFSSWSNIFFRETAAALFLFIIIFHVIFIIFKIILRCEKSSYFLFSTYVRTCFHTSVNQFSVKNKKFYHFCSPQLH